jgi:NAD(P)-binding Rossmann-like domain
MVKLFSKSEWEEDYVRSVGLLPDQLCKGEAEFLSLRIPDIQLHLNSYLHCRNYLIKSFAENSSEFVDIDQDLATEIQDADPQLLIAAEEFLDLHRYINYGLIKMPEIEEWKVSIPLRLVVIGANLTGVVAAREIHNLFTKNRIKTDITIIERTPRIGGKTFTFPISCNFEEYRQPCIELGTKKIYGIG